MIPFVRCRFETCTAHQKILTHHYNDDNAPITTIINIMLMNEIITPTIANPLGFLKQPIIDKIMPKIQGIKLIIFGIQINEPHKEKLREQR
jgi:hypothetical protein